MNWDLLEALLHTHKVANTHEVATALGKLRQLIPDKDERSQWLKQQLAAAAKQDKDESDIATKTKWLEQLRRADNISHTMSSQQTVLPVGQVHVAQQDSQWDSIKETALQFEYDQLRKEILQNQNLGLVILGVTVTFVGTVITVATNSNIVPLSPFTRSIIFFVSAIITYIAMVQSVSLVSTTFMIASYMRIFTERQMQYVRWETRINKLRSTNKHPYEPFGTYQRWFYVIIVLITCFLGEVFFGTFLYQSSTREGIGRLVKSVQSALNLPHFGLITVDMLLAPLLAVVVISVTIFTLLCLKWILCLYDNNVTNHRTSFEVTWNRVLLHEVLGMDMPFQDKWTRRFRGICKRPEQ